MDGQTIELKDISPEKKQANFEAGLRQVLKVDKVELDRRIQADKEKRKQRKADKQK